MKRHLSGVKLPEGAIKGPTPRRGKSPTLTSGEALTQLRRYLEDLGDTGPRDRLRRSGFLTALLEGSRSESSRHGGDLWSDDSDLISYVNVLTHRTWAFTQAVHHVGFVPVWSDGAARLTSQPGKPLVAFIDTVVRRYTPYPADVLVNDARRQNLDLHNTLASLALFIDATIDDLAFCCSVHRHQLLRLCWGQPEEP